MHGARTIARTTRAVSGAKARTAATKNVGVGRWRMGRPLGAFIGQSTSFVAWAGEEVRGSLASLAGNPSPAAPLHDRRSSPRRPSPRRLDGGRSLRWGTLPASVAPGPGFTPKRACAYTRRSVQWPQGRGAPRGPSTARAWPVARTTRAGRGHPTRRSSGEAGSRPRCRSW